MHQLSELNALNDIMLFMHTFHLALFGWPISFSGITWPWAAGGQCHGLNEQLNLLQIYHCLLNRYFCAFMGEMNGVSALHVRSHPYLYVIHTGPIQVDSRQPHGPLYDPQGFRNLNISFTRKREGNQKVQTSKNDNIIS